MFRSIVLFAAGAMILAAQDDKVTVPFRDPSGAKTLKVSLQNGSVTVKGYEGKDAIIETSTATRVQGRERHSSNIPPGMHRVDGPNFGLDVTEENNIINVVGDNNAGHITIQVPVQTSLVLRSVNGGAITVENISGSIDANHTNGGISITNVSGSVLANTTNGKVIVSLNKVTPDKAMSFTSFNGVVDCDVAVSTGDIKANVMMKTNNGEIWSDFDLKLGAGGKPPVVENHQGKGGKYKVHIDRAMYGSDQRRCGPEMQFVTYNGNILIHKK